jgi:hypothetical protein
LLFFAPENHSQSASALAVLLIKRGGDLGRAGEQLQEIAHLPKHTLESYGQCLAALFLASYKRGSPSNGEQLTKLNGNKNNDSLVHQLSLVHILNIISTRIIYPSFLDVVDSI